jgi:hypothetical protein
MGECLEEDEGDLYDLTGIVEDGKVGKITVDAARTLLDGKRQLARDRRRVLVAACISYRRSVAAYASCVDFQKRGGLLHSSAKRPEDETNDGNLDSAELALLNLLRQRQGDANNELGKFLLQELRELLSKGKGTDDPTFAAAEALLASAQFWFQKGLEAFESSSDIRNSALLRCNLCQCYKLKANANFVTSGPTKEKGPGGRSDRSLHADACLKEAIQHLQAAHARIGQRDMDPGTWDMVSDTEAWDSCGD